MTTKELEAIEEREWENIAALFHDTYERLAPSFGYKTRRETAVAWEMVKESNRRLMTATVAEIMPTIIAEAERRGERKAWEDSCSFNEDSLKRAYEKFKELPMPALAELKKTEYAKGYRLGWEMAISAFMSYVLPISIKECDAKLNALK